MPTEMPLPEEEQFKSWIKRGKFETWLKNPSDEHIDISDLRKIRNGIAAYDSVREAVEAFTEEEKDLLNSCLSSWIGEEKFSSLVMLLQILGNLTVNNENGRKIVWSLLGSHSATLISATSENPLAAATMAIYNCIRDESIRQDLLESRKECLVAIGKNLVAETGNEWHLFIIQEMFGCQGFVQKFLADPNLPSEIFLMCLEVADDSLSQEEGIQISSDNSEYFLQMLCTYQVDAEWAKPERDWNQDEVKKFCKTLGVAHKILGRQTGPISAEVLSLSLKKMVQHLKTISKLGKQGHSSWTIRTDLKELAGTDLSQIQDSLSFGLKSDLVQFIANACAENPAARVLLAEEAALPLLLDSSAPDGRNPFITQRVIFAIRNLCKDCAPNQALLAGLDLRGSSIDPYELGVPPPEKRAR